MKRWFIICLIGLVATVGLVALIEYDPGYLLMSYGHWTLETSIWVALALLILVLLLVWVLVSLVRYSIRHSTALSQWFNSRSSRRVQEQTTRGMIAYIEGNWERSRRILSRSAEKSDMPLINYLFAARASNELGDAAETKLLLSKAEASTTGAGIAVELAQAEMQYKNGKLEQCLATLTRVRSSAGKHPFLLKLLKSTYIGLNDWDGLSRLLPDLSKAKVLDKKELSALELQCSKALLLDAASLNDDEAARSALNNCWQKQSKAVARNSDVVEVYVDCLIGLNDEIQAEKVLCKQLGRDWSRSLIDRYGKVTGQDVSKQLLHAENWLKERNNDARLMLCLGRLSMRNQLWGKAKEYFEHSLKLENSPESCAELGRLLASLGEHEKSNYYFQQGLLMSTHGLPTLPVPHS
mgnify:FL=1